MKRIVFRMSAVVLTVIVLILPYASAHAQTQPLFFHTLKTALADRTTGTESGIGSTSTVTPPTAGATEQVDVERVTTGTDRLSAYNAGHDSTSSVLAAVGAILALLAVVLIVIFAFVVPRKKSN